MARGIVLAFKREDRLTFTDIAVLKAIADFTKTNGRNPTRDDLFHRATYTGIVNKWLKKARVDAIYASPITGSDQIDLSLQVLRRLGFVEESGNYGITDKGLEFLNQVGSNWRRWAISVPINEDNTLMTRNARYAPEF